MPIDTSIYSHIALPAPMPTPQQRQATHLEALKQRLTLRDLANQEQIRHILQQTGGDLEQAGPAILAIDPELGMKVAQQVASTKAAKLKAEQDQAETETKRQTSAQAAAEQAAKQAASLVSTVKDQTSWDRVRPQLAQVPGAQGWVASMGPDYEASKDAIAQQVEEARNRGWLKEPPPPKAPPPLIQRDPTRALVNPQTGETVSPAEPPAPPKLTFSGPPQWEMVKGHQTMVRSGSDGKLYDMNQQPIAPEDLAPMPPKETATGTQQTQDAKDVVESVKGMGDGSIPPILPSRASREYTNLMAEAHRQGVNLVKLNEDWTATQKYLGTLNGQQQVRLRQAVQFTKESLPIVESLAQQWDAGKYPILNKANLALAKNGAFGQAAASLATKLEAQIADLTSELGTVYKGGNSSTDESLALAAKNLSANWSKQTLLDNIRQIRQNLQIREQSIRLGAPIANENNQYAPTVAPAAVTPPAMEEWVRDPKTGKLVKKGTP